MTAETAVLISRFQKVDNLKAAIWLAFKSRQFYSFPISANTKSIFELSQGQLRTLNSNTFYKIHTILSTPSRP